MLNKTQLIKLTVLKFVANDDIEISTVVVEMMVVDETPPGGVPPVPGVFPPGPDPPPPLPPASTASGVALELTPNTIAPV